MISSNTPSLAPPTVLMPHTLSEHLWVKFEQGKTYEQAKAEIGRDMPWFTHAWNAPNLDLSRVHQQDTEAAVNQVPSHSGNPTADRKRTRRPRILSHKGKQVEIRELLGRKFKSSSKYAESCRQKRCSNEVWKGDGCTQNHLKKRHHDDIKSKDGTYTCCNINFLDEKRILDHVLKMHMEDVVTVGPPNEPRLDAIEKSVSVSIATPGSNASPTFNSLPLRPTYCQGQYYAPNHAPSHAIWSAHDQPMRNFVAPAIHSAAANQGVLPMRLAPYTYAPQRHSPGHVHQPHFHGSDGAFGQLGTRNNTSPFTTDPNTTGHPLSNTEPTDPGINDEDYDELFEWVRANASLPNM